MTLNTPKPICEEGQCPFLALSRSSRYGSEIAYLTEGREFISNNRPGLITECCARSTAHFLRTRLITHGGLTLAQLNTKALKSVPGFTSTGIDPNSHAASITYGMQLAIDTTQTIMTQEKPNLINLGDTMRTILALAIREIVTMETESLLGRTEKLAEITEYLKLVNSHLHC